MRNMYSIRTTDDKHFAAVIVAMGYQSPLEHLPSIVKELHEKSISGEVLFDLLCSNGYEWNRFASMRFNGQNFERKTFQVIDSNKVSCSLAREHEVLVGNRCPV